MLGLMLLDNNDQADEHAHVEIIRKHLLAHSGPLRADALEDKGAPTIWKLVWDAETRLAKPRAQSLKTVKAWQVRQRAAKQPAATP